MNSGRNIRTLVVGRRSARVDGGLGLVDCGEVDESDLVAVAAEGQVDLRHPTERREEVGGTDDRWERSEPYTIE